MPNWRHLEAESGKLIRGLVPRTSMSVTYAMPTPKLAGHYERLPNDDIRFQVVSLPGGFPAGSHEKQRGAQAPRRCC